MRRCVREGGSGYVVGSGGGAAAVDKGDTLENAGPKETACATAAGMKSKKTGMDPAMAKVGVSSDSLNMLADPCQGESQ